MKESISRKAKSKVKTHTINEYKEMASNAIVNNDQHFINIPEEEKERREDIKKYSQLSFWKGLSIKEGFRTHLKQVIPQFWNSEMELMSKKDIIKKTKSFFGKGS